MDRDSTVTEQLAVRLLQQTFLVLPIEPCRVEHWSSSDGKEHELRFRSSIVDLTFKAERGTLPAELVQLWRIASQDPSSGDLLLDEPTEHFLRQT